jgi:hypothetical protein
MRVCPCDTITGTQLSAGGGVRMATTEGDITLTAANIAAEKDVTIRAAGNLTRPIPQQVQEPRYLSERQMR